MLNLNTAYFCIKCAIPIMEKNSGGSIVNISSVAALRYVSKPQVGYSASKAALIQMTKTTAVIEAKKNIRLNCVVPGLMHTPLVDRLAQKYADGDYEGFVRQLIGWREYERMLYVLDYENLISSNYFGNKKKLNKKWYTGETGLKPIDDTIIKAFKNGYLHHIERLMVMLNFMNLARIHPRQIYNWFMEFSCDSYDWVMVGNVYGMGYFSTNTMRKPYLSTSNYIRQMTDYKNDGHWNEIWDALFYKFLTDNKPKLKGGAAVYLRNLVHFEKKSSKEKKEIFESTKLIL